MMKVSRISLLLGGQICQHSSLGARLADLSSRFDVTRNRHHLEEFGLQRRSFRFRLDVTGASSLVSQVYTYKRPSGEPQIDSLVFVCLNPNLCRPCEFCETA